MNGLHLAQFNVARLIAPIEAPASAEFREALDRVNALAEASPGFVWRATGTGFDSEMPADDVDPMILANLSVWESAEALAAFAYRSAHGGFVRRGRDWFEPTDLAQVVMWWIPAASQPTRDDGFARLERLRAEGPGVYAFDFKTRFAATAVLEPVP
jgi:heme-degrading monooxygenase HmoA